MFASASRLPGLAAALAAILVSTAPQATAATAPPAPPPPVLVPTIVLDTTAFGVPYIEGITFGTPPCPGCPPRACPDEPLLATVHGLVPGCVSFRGLRIAEVLAPFTVLVADFVVDTCGVGCPTVLIPFSGSVDLGPHAPGMHTLVLNVTVRTCPDTNSIARAVMKRVDYDVLPSCDRPPPIDSLVRTFSTLRILPERPCNGDSLTLQFAENGCPPCVHLTSLSMLRVDGFRAVLEWRPQCVEFACISDTLSMPLGRFAAGSYHLVGSVVVRVLDTINPDSIIAYRNDLDFQVARSCDTTGVSCVFPFLLTGVDYPACSLTVPPGGRGEVLLRARSPVPLGGIQGRMDCWPPFRVTNLRVPDGVQGLHLSWEREPEGTGVRYVLFSDAGVPIPAGTPPVLGVEVEADPAALPGTHAALSAVIHVASDPDGGDVPVCALRTLSIVAVGLCVLGDPDSCDANGDGRADVRDLVLMTHCFPHALSEADSARICRDCDGDGLFSFADLYCCARAILRLPFVPRDSVQASDRLRVTIDPPTAFGDGLLLHVHVLGADALGAAMVRLRYPAERWRADIPATLDRWPGTSVGWMPITDVSDPGVVHLGGVRIDEQAASDLEFLIVFTPTGTPLPGDQVVAEGADLAAQDGTVLTPSTALPSVTLGVPTPQPPGSGVELGPPSPNPFSRSTSFVVNLPADADVDLAVLDLAGRRVATVARGRLAAGRRAYTWDGSGLRDGVYFVRLQVDGRVLSTRVALLRDRR